MKVFVVLVCYVVRLKLTAFINIVYAYGLRNLTYNEIFKDPANTNMPYFIKTDLKREKKKGSQKPRN